MGKRTSLTDDDELFARAERVQTDAVALAQQLAALRKLRILERDFRNVTRELARAMEAIVLPMSQDALRRILTEAEELASPLPD